MRGLAEYVMNGRRQAIIAAVLLGVIPIVNLLNPVVVGLVVLRRGPLEGFIIFLWSLLPLLGWYSTGEFVPLIMLLSISGLSLLLRETGSWEKTLLAAILVGVGFSIFVHVNPDQIEALAELINRQSSPEQQSIQVERLQEVIPDYLNGFYVFLSIILLMIARWMQSILYNPGGFQKEFQKLRISPKFAMLLLGMVVLSRFEVFIPAGWLLYMLLPMLFSGIALIHAVVARNRMSRLWLVLFYLLLLLPYSLQFLALAALIDSLYDFRGRMNKPA
ncbi:MAG: hypothetical protein OXE78_00950 [Gammaproteobacteria bacterium]|nr:hypothetical protein [Gammaproteobacteria bacterium]MCY4357607.1 hypothetical protein [Gammaproteobacteria bacterium]